MKPTITKAEHWQLIGLLALAKHHSARIDDIKASVLTLLELTPAIDHVFNDPADHVSDAVYADFDAAQLLHRLKVDVAE
ncbi:MAG TPA: hypothetical protein VGR82_17775 [Methylomirabilota bacterium]|nr:hypothetical protein [Methylomirabilota bacterium]